MGGVSITVTASHVSTSSFLVVSAGGGAQGWRGTSVSRVRGGRGRPQVCVIPPATGCPSDAAQLPGSALTSSRPLRVADDVRHAGLEAHERRQVARLGGIILGELVHCGTRTPVSAVAHCHVRHRPPPTACPPACAGGRPGCWRARRPAHGLPTPSLGLNTPRPQRHRHPPLGCQRTLALLPLRPLLGQEAQRAAPRVCWVSKVTVQTSVRARSSSQRHSAAQSGAAHTEAPPGRRTFKLLVRHRGLLQRCFPRRDRALPYDDVGSAFHLRRGARALWQEARRLRSPTPAFHHVRHGRKVCGSSFKSASLLVPRVRLSPAWPGPLGRVFAAWFSVPSVRVRRAVGLTRLLVGGALLGRLVVVPTVTVLGMIKIRLIAAKKGHQLLKKKARGAGGTPRLRGCSTSAERACGAWLAPAPV